MATVDNKGVTILYGWQDHRNMPACIITYLPFPSPLCHPPLFRANQTLGSSESNIPQTLVIAQMPLLRLQQIYGALGFL